MDRHVVNRTEREGTEHGAPAGGGVPSKDGEKQVHLEHLTARFSATANRPVSASPAASIRRSSTTRQSIRPGVPSVGLRTIFPYAVHKTLQSQAWGRGCVLTGPAVFPG